MERKMKERYNIIPEKEPCLGTDHPSFQESFTRRKRHWVWPTVVNIIIFLGYTVAYMTLFMRNEPMRTALHEIDGLKLFPMPKAYDDFEKSPFAGPPSPSLDSAWHNLLDQTTIRVTEEELKESNQTSVALPEGGGYMAWLGVFHELHCIKMIRQWIYRDHYHPNLTAEDIEEWSVHADHCLDVLRSAALCHGDTTLTTFGWANKTKPMLNTRPIDHKCVNWEILMGSVTDRTVGKDEMAALTNPLLQ